MVDFNPFTLENKTVLVTGASSGIGRSIAVACSKMGAKLIITGRNEQKLDDTQSLLHPNSHVKVICDLTDKNSVQLMVEGLPKLDGVVHCAGIGQRLLCRQLSEDNVDIVLGVNFKAPVLLQGELLKQKKINKACSIVFMASIASWVPSVGNAVYSASKAAIASYAKCLSLELAPRLIRVNCISPGMVWTDFIKYESILESQLKEDESKYPLKRYGTPEDIAYLAIYLLSDASSWMTGSNVKISGGEG